VKLGIITHDITILTFTPLSGVFLFHDQFAASMITNVFLGSIASE
jgi:hypothetical protein